MMFTRFFAALAYQVVSKKRLKVEALYSASWEIRLRAMGCRLPLCDHKVLPAMS